ncbi:MAG: aminoglycoside phosphotransferase family protein [Deltaproteobacteria bacterium]|nr:aminoglycoside phosphotransferase family protein [Deltaproteobacteria bacterium]MBW2363421.1 aminoglycoside phosphotransferase family protein [Deltaproteobacteria bacterium]
MSTPIVLPDSAESISPEWLTRVLSERFPGARAEHVEVVDAHSGTTGRARLRVRWQAGSDAPTALFAKLAPTDPIQREMVVSMGMGRREARFYAELAAELPVRVPAPIWAGWKDDGSAYFMLIEDLAEAGCGFPSSAADDAGEHARGMMDTLATLHGRYWNSPRFAEDLAWIEAPMRGAVGPLLVGAAVEQFGERMPDAFHRLADLYIQHTDSLNDLLDDGTPTLVHGDCHLGNSFVDAGRVGLLDWACSCRAPGFRDVAYYLCNSLPIERRRQLERPLLERYLAGLAAAGGAAPDFDTAWQLLRRYAVTSWVAATVTAAAGSRMQSEEIGQRAMERATAAIVDFDTPALLCRELGV